MSSGFCEFLWEPPRKPPTNQKPAKPAGFSSFFSCPLDNSVIIGYNGSCKGALALAASSYPPVRFVIRMTAHLGRRAVILIYLWCWSWSSKTRMIARIIRYSIHPPPFGGSDSPLGRLSPAPLTQYHILQQNVKWFSAKTHRKTTEPVWLCCFSLYIYRHSPTRLNLRSSDHSASSVWFSRRLASTIKSPEK